MLDHLADRRNLLELAFDEALSAKAGIHAHHQDQVDHVDQIVEHLGGRGRVQDNAGPLAQSLDMLDRAMDVRPRLRVDGDRVRPCLGKGVQIGIDRRDHQMHVERLGGVRAQRLHHRRADGDVGHEMPVHHIDVDPVGAGGVDGPSFFA